jgi:hypothetical protein
MFEILLIVWLITAEGASVTTNKIGNYPDAQSCQFVAKQLNSDKAIGDYVRETVVARCVQTSVKAK